MIKILENLKTIDESYVWDRLNEVGVVNDAVNGVRGVILDCRRFDVTQWRELQVVSRVGVGVDNIDVEECTKRNVRVCVTSCRELNIAVAEFTLLSILRLLRGSAKGGNLNGRKVGVIGYGRIGSTVGGMLFDHDCTVMYYDKALRSRSKERVLAESDIVTIHVSGNEEVIGEKELKLMKEGSYLVNMARAGCVDETAVASALGPDGRLAGFASDVNGSWLKAFSGTVITPHIASSTVEARAAMERMAVDNLVNELKRRNEKK